MSKKDEKESMTYEDARPKLDTVGNLTDLEGETLDIINFELLAPMGNLGECSIVTILRENGETEKRHTFSKVLIKQLKEIEGKLKSRKITATVTKQKNYYVFKW